MYSSTRPTTRWSSSRNVMTLPSLARITASRRFQPIRELLGEAAYRHPTAWADLRPEEYDGLILPGGHAPGMRQYLDSEVLREKIAAFWSTRRPVGAICHGVLALARTIDPATGRSVIA